MLNLNNLIDSSLGWQLWFATGINAKGQIVGQGSLNGQEHGFLLGVGVKQDYQQALSWYRKSAEKGSAAGQYNLGWLYQHGLGIAQDYVQAVTWYHKAAEQGLAGAENQLGLLYLYGNGAPQDDQQAAMWFRKAADQGYAETELNIGWLYANGRGVRQDYQQALTFYRKAADQGKDAQLYLAELSNGAIEQEWQSASTSNPQSVTAPAVTAAAGQAPPSHAVALLLT